MKRLSFLLLRPALFAAAVCANLAGWPAAFAQIPDANSGDQWDKLHNQSQPQRQVDGVRKGDWRAPRERGRETRDWRPENDRKHGRRIDNGEGRADWLDQQRRSRDEEAVRQKASIARNGTSEGSFCRIRRRIAGLSGKKPANNGPLRSLRSRRSICVAAS